MFRGFRTSTLCALAIVALITLSARSAPTTAPTGEDTPVVTRVYDISDLLWQKTDYPSEDESAQTSPQMPPGSGVQSLFTGSAQPASPPPQKLSPPDVFIKLIESTVASDSWKNNGGSIGSIQELSGKLVVTQTPENHQAIEKVIEAMRADRGKMVIVRAFWLMLDPQTVASISNSASSNQLPIVDDKLIDDQHLYCGAQTMCFSGQTVHIVSGRTRSILKDLTPVVGQDSVGFNPTIDEARSGVTLQVTPHLEPEGNDQRAVLDLASNVTEIGNLNGDKIEVPTTTQPSANPAQYLDRVNEVNQQFQTTVRLPIGKKVLVGGMTLEPASKDAAGKQLYLIVEADAVK